MVDHPTKSFFIDQLYVLLKSKKNSGVINQLSLVSRCPLTGQPQHILCKGAMAIGIETCRCLGEQHIRAFHGDVVGTGNTLHRP